MATQRLPKGPMSGGHARSPTAATNKRRLARLGDLARRSSLSADAAASPDAAAAAPSPGTPLSRSSPHTAAPGADVSADPVGDDAAPVQPSRVSSGWPAFHSPVLFTHQHCGHHCHYYFCDATQVGPLKYR